MHTFLTDISHFRIQSVNVNFVSNIRKLLSRNITQLIDTHLPQCRSTDEANNAENLKKIHQN